MAQGQKYEEINEYRTYKQLSANHARKSLSNKNETIYIILNNERHICKELSEKSAKLNNECSLNKKSQSSNDK